RMLAVFFGHHPMKLSARRCLNKEWIDAAAMVAGDDAALICRQRQLVQPPRTPEKLAQQVRDYPEKPLKRRQGAAAKRHDKCRDGYGHKEDDKDRRDQR